MRRLAERPRVEAFMRALGDASHEEARVYFTGGATAVLSGWRSTTVDLDLAILPERDELLRVLPRLKEELEINVEIASPPDFIPELPGWETRSRFIGREGRVSFYHYDPYSQALSKLERGHAQDREDVAEMLRRKWIDHRELLRLFEEIEPRLYRYPALDPASFRRAVEEVAEGREERGGAPPGRPPGEKPGKS